MRLGRWGVRLGLAAGAFLLVNQLLRRESEPSPNGSTATRTGPPPDPQPEPQAGAAGDAEVPEAPTAAAATVETAPGAAATTTAEAVWVDPEAGTCPVSHPVKVKLSSGIFHEPGMLAYDRTVPDRCYRDATTAEADGFRRAKR